MNILPDALTSAFSRRLDAAVHSSLTSSPSDRAGHRRFIGICLALSIVPLAALPIVAASLEGFDGSHLLAFVSMAVFSLPAWTLSNTGSVGLAHRLRLLATMGASAAIVTAFPATWLACLVGLLWAGWSILLKDRTYWALAAAAAVAAAIVGHLVFLGTPEVTQPSLMAGLALVMMIAWGRRGSEMAVDGGSEGQVSLGSILKLDRSSRVLECDGPICADLDLKSDHQGFVHRVHVADRVELLACLDRAANGDEAEEIRIRLSGASHGWHPVRLLMKRSGDGHVDVLLTCDAEATRLRGEIERLTTELESANASKTRFIATMSHELRTPLNAILGFSDLLRQSVAGPVSERQTEYLNDIHGAGEHLLSLVNDILDASKIEAGYYQLACDEFELEPVLATVCSLVECSRNGSGVTIRKDVQPGLHSIFADQKAFKQIVINLLSNAAKFSHQGGEVALSLERHHKGVLLTITDQGVGMSEDDLAAACEPFVQAQNGHARHAEGTGLGLAIVKGFVELHGGRLMMSSALGHGTTVKVLLPNVQPSAVHTEVQQDEEVVVPIAQLKTSPPSLVTPLPTADSDVFATTTFKSA
ncbi:MAG: HAMP domain-containing sensor histidine kinase [Pseudomonadota bacterium]